jgi:sodium-dependent phosphate cotransporter
MDPPSAVQTRPPEAPLPAPKPPSGQRALGTLWWLLRFALALFLFVGALQVMKTGAEQLALLQGEGLLVRNAGSTLGLGWLGALLVLSGSPIAASALTLVKAGSITTAEGFTMVAGSRLGAAFVVLAVAVLYAMRGTREGGERYKPLSTAVMALATTAMIYVPGAMIGYGLLRWDGFRAFAGDISLPTRYTDLVDAVYGSILDTIDSWPPVVLFVGGLGILLLSFKVIDTILPHLDERSLEERRLDWLTRKWPMFWLGCFVALVTMSVSVALTVLVPLNAKGYAKREAMLPYIMGANITTLGDTLLAAFLLDSGAAVSIVLAGIVGTTITSLIVLSFFYVPARRAIFRFQRAMLKNKPRLAAFTAALFAVPIALILISGAVG